MADSQELFEQIVSTTLGWPESFKSKVSFEFKAANYPAGQSEMKDVYESCATLVLFVPELLPEYDTVLYLDTDVIFMESPEDIWRKFYNFGSEQMISLATARLQYSNRSDMVSIFVTI